ncbi:MAG TPA: B12-binding domain-containing radical SAM protein [Aigarchaeota archaeon]|nr:B12-binding domain-containing radical SAM protein [Aigarchaeota archaeon]
MQHDVVLIFPYFDDGRSRQFKFPPLGIGYIASYLRRFGYKVKIIDCTFSTWEHVIAEAQKANAKVIGIYSMLSMVNNAIQMAKTLRGCCELLVAGGPMPSAYPQKFLGVFDVVVQGEGEETMVELMEYVEGRRELGDIRGIYAAGNIVKETQHSVNGGFLFTGQRPLIKNLDTLPFPARELYDNESYRRYYRSNFGYTMTSMVASRGCPFSCGFCWRPDYGRVYRVRSPSNIVDEMEEVRYRYGYERIWFADELFIANKKHTMALCKEIIERGLDVEWECLARADLIDDELAKAMRRAGCYKIIFGLESGDDRTLKLMNKQLKVEQSKRAVETIKRNGIKAGAFFILGYPGENNETMLNTIRFASSLPLDYFSMTIPYPLPGTDLYERVKHKMLTEEWEKPRNGWDHKLLFEHDFSNEKLRYGIWMAITRAKLRKKLGPLYYLLKPWEVYTEFKFRRMN